MLLLECTNEFDAAWMASTHLGCEITGPLDLAINKAHLAAVVLTGSAEEADRKAFVLRTLTGLPAKSCAALLGMSADRVDRDACAAAEHLAWFTKSSQN